MKRVKANVNIGDVHIGGIYEVIDEDARDYFIKDDIGEEAYYGKTSFDVIETFNSWEIAKMIYEGNIRQGTKLRWDKGLHVYTMKGKSLRDEDGKEMGCSMLTTDKEYIILEVPDEEVAFLEAVNSGKLIRYEYEDAKSSFHDLEDTFDILSQSYNSDKIRNIIMNGKWFIKN